MTIRSRKAWLRSKRRALVWDYEQTARRLRCTVAEYKSFEIGKTEKIGDLTFYDVMEYMEGHLGGVAGANQN